MAKNIFMLSKTSDLCTSKYTQTEREKSSTIVKKYDAPQDEVVLHSLLEEEALKLLARDDLTVCAKDKKEWKTERRKTCLGRVLRVDLKRWVDVRGEVTNQSKEIQHLKAQIKKLKKKAKPVITHHKAWMKSVSMKQRLARKKTIEEKGMQKCESVSKQGRKSAKSEPTVHKDPAFDDLDNVDVNDAMDYMETDAYMQKGVSTEDQVSTVKPDEGTDKPKVSSNKPEVSTAKPKEVEVSTDKLDEGTAEPKDGTSDERKVQEDWEAEEEMKKLAEKEATKAALI
ncbi:hypothetical protein Tco_0474499 [Tanacetum coccineum]